MATEYTVDTSIKKIGTGLESGTWGKSTNQNFERISAFLGKFIELDLINMPSNGSVDGTPNGVTPATWVTLDTSDSDSTVLGTESGAEGRCRAVKIIGSGLAADITLKVRGQTITTEVNRVYAIWNSTAYVVTIDSGGGTYALAAGAYALIACKSQADGALSAGVYNLMSNPQFEDIKMVDAGAKISFNSSGEVEFIGDGTVTIPTNSATAFVINDGINDLFKVDTTTGVEVITLDAASGTTIDLSGGDTQPSEIIVQANTANALTIKDSATDVLTMDTTAGSVVVSIGKTASTSTLKVLGDLNFTDQTADIDMLTGSATSLSFMNGAQPMLTFDTFDDDVIFPLGIQAPIIELYGGSPYILGTPNATPSSGYGFRNNSGVMEVANNATVGVWNPIAAAIVGVALTDASATQAIAAASVGNGSKGSFDIGPIRIIFNTVDVAPNGGAGTTITLGDTGNGTDAAMNSILYTVMAVLGENATEGSAIICEVTSGAAGTFVLRSPGDTRNITYWAIGDSGA